MKPNEIEPKVNSQVESAFRSDKMMRYGMIMTAGATIFFAVVGAACGWILGYFAPGYYRAMMNLEDAISPAEVGVGLGLTQGAILGLIMGLGVWGFTAWYKSRVKLGVLKRIESNQSP